LVAPTSAPLYQHSDRSNRLTSICITSSSTDSRRSVSEQHLKYTGVQCVPRSLQHTLIINAPPSPVAAGRPSAWHHLHPDPRQRSFFYRHHRHHHGTGTIVLRRHGIDITVIKTVSPTQYCHHHGIGITTVMPQHTNNNATTMVSATPWYRHSSIHRRPTAGGVSKYNTVHCIIQLQSHVYLAICNINTDICNINTDIYTHVLSIATSTVSTRKGYFTPWVSFSGILSTFLPVDSSLHFGTLWDRTLSILCSQ